MNIIKSILRNFFYKGKNSIKDFLIMVKCVIIYFVLLFLYFLFVPKSVCTYITSLGFLIPFLLTSFILLLFTTSFIKVIKKREVNIILSIFIKIIHILFCLILGLILFLSIQKVAYRVDSKIDDLKYEMRKKEALLEAENEQKEKLLEQEKFNMEFSKIDSIPGYMKVISDVAPGYLFPIGIHNPFDLEELELNISNGEKVEFIDLYSEKLRYGLVVKPLFEKIDPNGNKWILVYLNKKTEKQTDFVFVESKYLETVNSFSDEFFFEDEEYMLENWKYHVAKQSEYYSNLWTK